MSGRTGATPLTPAGEIHRIRLGGIQISGKRRRPSGEKAPLPKSLRRSGRVWLATAIAMVLAWLSLFVWPESERWWYRFDHWITNGLADLRTDGAVAVVKGINALGSLWTIRALRWGTLALLAAYRRWRHLVVFIVAIALTEWCVATLNQVTIRERPLAVEILGPWSGSSHPSASVASLTVTLAAMRYSLVPQGRWKARWWWIGGVIGALSGARVFLGIDHPSDVIFAFVIGIAFGVLSFRLLAPQPVFPIAYRRATPAHLDVTGGRQEVIRTAVGEQLGISVLDIEPFALEGSAGSTPLRLRVRGESADRFIFGKLYASAHLRSDRWYKLTRTVLYGYLEDETSFNSVTRLVEYEDYMLRVMRDAGVPSPEPFGFVELVPEREYVVLTEFYEHAEQLDEAQVGEDLIDDALSVVRTLWDAGLAHRDLKPANILVTDGRIRLIDVAFGTARPTAWRQAVDLANMMLVLGLRADPRRVYELALDYFTPAEVAEAFAATHSVTMPRQLRTSLRRLEKVHGLDLISEFRRMGPPSQPISVQRWSLRRLGLTVSVAAGAVSVGMLIASNLRQTGFL